MKNVIIALFCSLSGFALMGNNSFEGTMVLTNTSEESSMNNVVLNIKNNLVAIEPSGDLPQMMLDLNTSNMYALVKQGSQKMVVKANMNILNEVGLFSLLDLNNILMEGVDEDLDMQKTSETKKINGYNSTKYAVDNEEMKGEVWLTGEVPFDFSLLFKMLGLETPWENGQQLVPLKGTVKDKESGKTSTFSMAVEEKPIADQLFNFIQDYPSMDITNMIKQMVADEDPQKIKDVLGKMIKGSQ